MHKNIQFPYFGKCIFIYLFIIQMSFEQQHLFTSLPDDVQIDFPASPLKISEMLQSVFRTVTVSAPTGAFCSMEN